VLWPSSWLTITSTTAGGPLSGTPPADPLDAPFTARFAPRLGPFTWSHAPIRRGSAGPLSRSSSRVCIGTSCVGLVSGGSHESFRAPKKNAPPSSCSTAVFTSSARWRDFSSFGRTLVEIHQRIRSGVADSVLHAETERESFFMKNLPQTTSERRVRPVQAVRSLLLERAT